MNRKKYSLLIVDDDPNILDAVSSLVREFGYYTEICRNPEDALFKIKKGDFSVVITDIKMPEMSGIELLEIIHNYNKELPVILMTAYAELDIAINAVSKGAFDFITKPFRPEYLRHAIKKAVNYNRLIQLEKTHKSILEDTVKKRTKDLKEAVIQLDSLYKEIILRLTTVAEFRDIGTGVHISRIGYYAREISKQLNMSKDFIETITYASTLHDIGKIGIHDDILLKTGFLTMEEFEVMKSHTLIGKKILSGSSHPVLRMAESIALNHHERFDGKGYPRGLKGREIPIEGRIVIICDQYDALMSERPYKTPYDHKIVIDILTKGDGKTDPKGFDPDILEVFIKIAPLFQRIFEDHKS